MVEQERPTIARQFIVHLHGKEFVLVAGLLDLAHQMGLRSIETRINALSNPEKEFWVMEAIVTFNGPEGGVTWSAFGDASPTSSQMRGAYLRHAETRAIARALRFATNVGMCSVEELGGEDPTLRQNGQQTHQEPAAVPRARHDPQDAAAAPVCEWQGCNRKLTPGQARLSEAKFKAALCPEHQAKQPSKTAA